MFFLGVPEHPLNGFLAEIVDSFVLRGVCTFSVLEDEYPEANPEMGDGLRITCEDVTCFVGYVFKCSYTPSSRECKVTACDQLRYLKANETFVFKNNETAGRQPSVSQKPRHAKAVSGRHW